MKDKFPHRKQIRLKEYDYSQEGYYFVTICTQNRKHILSRIIDEGTTQKNAKPVGADPCVRPQIELTNVGKQIEKSILKINDVNTKVDEYIIMPNHIHMIIQITGGQRRPPLQRIIQCFKSATTNRYFIQNKEKLWQRNYYEHVVRNEKEYYLIKQYIQNNPLNWEKDKYY